MEVPARVPININLDLFFVHTCIYRSEIKWKKGKESIKGPTGIDKSVILQILFLRYVFYASTIMVSKIKEYYYDADDIGSFKDLHSNLMIIFFLLNKLKPCTMSFEEVIIMNEEETYTYI